MKKIIIVLLVFTVLSCKTTSKSSEDKAYSKQSTKEKTADFVLTFGSCNKPNQKNLLWDDIAQLNPDVWLWGGDIIYADTENMDKMEADYNLQKKQKGYANLLKETKVLGTWDDHDFGANDAGAEYPKKEKSQELLLNFLGVDKNSPRRKREGVYNSEVIETAKGSVKIILLDTRYFRTIINKKSVKGDQDNRTILGEQQWAWLESELVNSSAKFNIIVSSVQVIAEKHPYEKWANFPLERKKLLDVIVSSKANNVILLSGDRHISEFSKEEVNGLTYPLIDFTSSGMTHASENFTKEYNPARVGKVISTKSFGVLKINFDKKEVVMEMRGDGTLQQKIVQTYPI
ncbi:alkaline phosphatase D family protein [Polaribacter sp. Q13]|uniref:alkaline phosphatase D family protein n=1 Tax=Polaribacter sp. Q13 TaxID=2806551 RepID=UPI00193B298E|nr:alkaline phosphatase D family protein [Polaribacter sp. Q13]QVY67431.1 alkaline phosphatase family protein [Polaribacter sp. Q13]